MNESDNMIIYNKITIFQQIILLFYFVELFVERL